MPRAPLLLPLLALSSALLGALYVVDLLKTRAYPSTCEMTWSWPVYTPLVWPEARHAKYALYRIDMQHAHAELDWRGIPVLFVPGHMGSYRQARSIARHLWDLDPARFDVFALDFQEEWTGVHGALVREQATYVNVAVRAILKRYRKLQHKLKHSQIDKSQPNAILHVPESVLVVAHSMGGVVVRMAQVLPTYKRHSIQHVVAMGAPYDRPPFPFDVDLQRVYAEIDAHTRAAASNLAADAPTTLISIAGGHKDTMVHASLSVLDRAVAKDYGLALLAPIVPQVERTIDHLCLTWCHELLHLVAASLDAIVDPATGQVLPRASRRMDLLRRALLLGNGSTTVMEQGEDEFDAIDRLELLHLAALRDGYSTPQEFARYKMWTPRFFVRVLRARVWALLWMMFAVVLQILTQQTLHWQTHHDPSITHDALHQDAFPSMTTMLHPAAHAPGQVRWIVQYLQTQYLTARRTTGTALMLVVGVLIELARRYDGVRYHAWQLLELVVLYAIALGLLFMVAWTLPLVRAVLQPALRTMLAIAHRMRLRRWIVITTILLIVLFVGHVRDFELLALDSMPRCLALLVLGSFVVFVLHLVELGVMPSAIPRDHQQYRNTLVAFYALSALPWIGSGVFFLQVVRFPPIELSTDLLVHSVLCIAQMALYCYLLLRAAREMLPLPPVAFFDATQDDTASSSSSSQQITAENCPRCLFEDGGPGAIFIEHTDPRETRVVKTGKEIVTVGPSFRVVECDCVFRFSDRRQYCEFCTRACRLCGGGSGNYQEAQRYQEYVEHHKTQQAMHGLVVVAFNLLLLCMLYNQREHLVYYATTVVTLVLLAYHQWLRHPVEVARLQAEHRKQAQRDAHRSAAIKKQQQKQRERQQQQKAKRTARREAATARARQQASRTEPEEPSLRQQYAAAAKHAK